VFSAVFSLFARPAIDGVLPMHVINASTPGTGKSLLSRAIVLIASGLEPTIMMRPKDEDEVRKNGLALMLEGHPAIVLDNISGKLASGNMAAIITAPQVTDRVLGFSRTATAQQRALWIVNGNNVSLSSENIRRSLLITLDAGEERPEDRRIKRSDLIRFIR